MDRAGPNAPSPSGLLWGYQLKREHGFLLERMQKVETITKGYDERIKLVEQVGDDMEDRIEGVKELKMTVKALQEDNDECKERLATLDGRDQVKIQDTAEGVKKMHNRVQVLERCYQTIEESAGQSSREHQSLLKRLEGVQERLQGAEAELKRLTTKVPDKLVKKNDPADIKVLMGRLDAMESQRLEEKRQAQGMWDRMTTLEKLCLDHEKTNTELSAEVSRLTAMLRTGAVTEGPHTGRTLPVPSSEPTTERIRTSNPTSLNIPTSPLPRHHIEGRQARYIEESPSANAHKRKNAKVYDGSPQPAQIVQQIPIESDVQEEDDSQDLDLGAQGSRSIKPAQQKPAPPNETSSKKRSVAPTQDPPEKRAKRHPQCRSLGSGGWTRDTHGRLRRPSMHQLASPAQNQQMGQTIRAAQQPSLFPDLPSSNHTLHKQGSTAGIDQSNHGYRIMAVPSSARMDLGVLPTAAQNEPKRRPGIMPMPPSAFKKREIPQHVDNETFMASAPRVR